MSIVARQGETFGRARHALVRMLAFVRRFVRSREVGLTILAAFVGMVAALFVASLSEAATALHVILFHVDGDRLSALPRIEPTLLVWPIVGGAILCILGLLWARAGRGDVVDPIEANALHGGRMSVRDSALVAIQTLVSNGFGASVGMEAGYTQIASSASSRIGALIKLRREDLRVIVGCGAAGAIAAAFNGPLTGAFYAFELILAQYAISYVAPIMAASIAGTVAIRVLGGAPFSLALKTTGAVTAMSIPWFIGLGVACALMGVIWMRALPVIERTFTITGAPRPVRPILGGVAVGVLGYISPQTLSGGHGALNLGLFDQFTAGALVLIAALKMLASAVSLGSGFRGGLFFSSLLVGALIGRALAQEIAAINPHAPVDSLAFALVGMGALAASVIGAPLTMSFLVLETTSDYALTGAVLAAAATSNLIVRELFGYSFSTWRFHLRGETIRSAQDIGWVRDLTVERLMRTDPATAPHNLDIGAFRLKFPLGSRQKVVLLDDQGRYDGIVTVADAHAGGHDESGPVAVLAQARNAALLAGMTIKQAMHTFDATQMDTLAVIDNMADRRLLGTLKETYATRRYADEMEKAHDLRL